MEEDYINMEMDSSFASIFNHPSNNNNSNSNNKEFEFQSFSTYSDHHDRHFTATASPADELFYMGKLLPLHLPPRLEMVEKILMHTYNNNNTNNAFEQKLEEEEEGEENFTTPLASNTPYLSCNISPADSCQVSRELNPQEYFLECSTTTTTTTTNTCKDQKKKSWTKKMIKQFKWGNFKSFFNKTSCAVDHHRYNDNTAVPAPSKTTNKNANNAPFGQIKYDEKVSSCSCNDKEYSSHRRSFSGAFIRSTLSKTYKKSNSSSCYCSNSSSDSSANVSVQVLRRSSSAVSSELESPIQAAIAHCKRSRDQQQQQYLIVFKKDC